MRLVTDWAGDVKPLMKAIQPLSPSHGAFASKRLNAFRMKLGKPILARFAHAITESFHVSGFGRSLAHADASNYDINRILLDPLGPFWRARRREVLSMLACAKTELTVQLNIYDLLHYLRGDYKNFASSGRAQDIAGILGNKKLSLALWKAATASPLNNRFVGEMRDYPEIVKGFGITLPIPRWWKAALKSLDRK